MNVPDVAKLLMMAGALLIIAGLLFWGFQKLPYLGKLPGDINIKRGNVQIYIPIATSILISIVLSVLLTIIFGVLSRR